MPKTDSAGNLRATYEHVYENGTRISRDQQGRFFMSGRLGIVKDAVSAKKLLKGEKHLLKGDGEAFDFSITGVKNDSLKMNHYKARQMYKGVPVYGKEVIVHTDSSGQVYAINGSISENVNVDVTPEITKTQAVATAKKSVNLPEKDNITSRHKPLSGKQPKEPELAIYNYNGKTYLVYVVELGYPGMGSWKIFVDAKSGSVLHKIDRVSEFTRTTGYGYGYYNDRRNLKIIKDNDGYYRLIQKTAADTYSYKNVIYTIDYYAYYYTDYDPYFADNNPVFDSEYQKVGVDAHYNIDVVFNYFKSKFGRNSYDGAGTVIPVFVNDVEEPINAYWDPYWGELYFGIGNDTDFAPFSTGLDVVAHEYTHAITTSEGVLEYEGQSGALNESFSDAFASVIDPDWQIGEDVVTPWVPGDAIRDLSNPALYHQPTHMDDFINTPDDNGGVHINSGIPNKAFYNIASQVGRDAAAKIYYRALTTYLTLYSDFADAKIALLQSAKDLYGVNSAQYRAVAYGWGAVGLVDPYSLSLNKSSVGLSIGTPETLQASIQYDDGSQRQVTEGVTWTSSNPAVVSVDQTGNLNPVARGSAVITASYAGLKATAAVTVTPQVTELLVDKTAASLLTGSSVAVKATALYNDGSRADVTKTATWSSSNNAVATAITGTVRGLARGEAVITVQYNGKSATVTVKVTPLVRNITASQPNLNLTIGDVADLTAMANYTDNSAPEDVTTTALWKSSNQKVATVAAGRVTAVGKGKTTITAEFNRKKVSIPVEVTPVVARLEVNRASVTAVIGGAKEAIKAKAYYVDNTSADVTKTSVWSSNNPGLATVQTGMVTGLVKGTTYVSVTYKDKTVDIPVKVIPRVSGLTASDAALNLTTGQPATQVRLTAAYVDGSNEDVTSLAVWKSSNSKVATVSGGAVTPLAKGTAIISGEFNRRKVNIKVVVTPVVQSLTLSQSEVSLVTGKSTTLKATVLYNDGSRATLTSTSGVSWSVYSGGQTVVTVTNGTVKAVGKGTATVTAEYKGKSAECIVRVVPPILSLTPGQTALQMTTGGDDVSVELTARYTDSTSENVAPIASWRSSNPRVATVSNGIITPVGPGSAYIYATFMGKTVTIRITVSNPG